MKTHLVVGALALGSLALAACGGSNLCQDAQNTWNNFNNKSAPCGYNALVFTRSTCDQDVGQCTDSDKSTAQTYFNCLNNLPTCNSNDSAGWASQVQACGNPTVSNQTCADAINAQ